MDWKRTANPALLLAACACAVALRSANHVNFVNPAGGYYFSYNMDSYEHLRRIILGVHSFPAFPAFDSYAGYPQGTGQLWPPLFDYLLSGVSVVFGGSRATTETVGLWANPFFSALTVLLAYVSAKRLFASAVAGIGAAFLLAFNPGHIAYTLAVKLDHHVLEPIAVLLLMMLPSYEKGGRLPRKGQALAAVLLVLTIFLWRGSTLYWMVLSASVLTRACAGKKPGLSRDYAAAFALAVVPVVVICVLDPWGTANGFLFSVISWFHVLVLLLLAVLLLVSGTRLPVRGGRVLLGVFAVVVAAALSRGPMPSFIRELLRSTLFLRGAGDPWIASMNEMQGIFSIGFLAGARLLTVSWFAVPVAAILAVRKWLAGGKVDDRLLNFAIWSPIFLLGLRFRYLHVAGVISAMALGYLVLAGSERWHGSRRTACAALLAVCVLVPGYPAYREYVTLATPAALQKALFSENGIFSWIRNNTPKTSFLLTPTSRPEYGILADWSYSPLVYYLAERPSLATGFGWETHGFYEQAGFFATAIPAQALSIARNNGIRYVLVGRKRNYLDVYQAIAAAGASRQRLPAGIVATYRPALSMYVRLAGQDGSLYLAPEGLVPACGNYRLLHEQTVNDGGHLKVFEVVNGASIRGRAVPGSVVDIKLPLVTTMGRNLVFADRTMTDSDGAFRFLVPYATEGRQGDTVPLAAYALSGTGLKATVVGVSENDVLQGKSIAIPTRP